MSIKAKITLYLILFVVGATLLITIGNAAGAKSNAKDIVGSWYVDTCGAPFQWHLIQFHADGNVTLTNSDAAEKNNSSSVGMGTWENRNKKIVGSLDELNADKVAPPKYTGMLRVEFTIELSADRKTFYGPAKASYFDADHNPIPDLQDLPATLKGRRIGLGSTIPVPDKCLEARA